MAPPPPRLAQRTAPRGGGTTRKEGEKGRESSSTAEQEQGRGRGRQGRPGETRRGKRKKRDGEEEEARERRNRERSEDTTTTKATEDGGGATRRGPTTATPEHSRHTSRAPARAPALREAEMCHPGRSRKNPPQLSGRGPAGREERAGRRREEEATVQMAAHRRTLCRVEEERGGRGRQRGNRERKGRPQGLIAATAPARRRTRCPRAGGP